MTRWRVTGCALVLTTLLFGAPPPALGHEVRPGYLEMTEVAPGRYDVVFKTPSSGGLRLKMHAVLPESCPATTLVSGHMTGRALLEQWTVQCEASLVGETITIDGLDALLTDVLVRIRDEASRRMTGDHAAPVVADTRLAHRVLLGSAASEIRPALVREHVHVSVDDHGCLTLRRMHPGHSTHADLGAGGCAPRRLI